MNAPCSKHPSESEWDSVWVCMTCRYEQTDLIREAIRLLREATNPILTESEQVHLYYEALQVAGKLEGMR